MVGYVGWCLDEGRRMTESLGFVPLPDAVVNRSKSTLSDAITATKYAAALFLSMPDGRNFAAVAFFGGQVRCALSC